MDGFKVEMHNPEVVAVGEIGIDEITPNDVALTLAFAVRQKGEMHVEWSAPMRAAIARWGINVAGQIKARAIDIASGKIDP